MSLDLLVDRLSQEKVVAIIRGIPEELLDQTAEALISAGIQFLEVTLNTEGALPAITRWRRSFSNVYIGAGTVLDLMDAKSAIDAGAQFLISPNVDEEAIRFAVPHVPFWAGAATPTEIVKAFKSGSSAVKVFPSGSLGTSYLKEIRGPLDHIPLIATGGVNLGNIQDYLATGVIAVGVGGSLVNKSLIVSKKFEELAELAKGFVSKAKGSEESCLRY